MTRSQKHLLFYLNVEILISQNRQYCLPFDLRNKIQRIYEIIYNEIYLDGFAI